jgi:hypothetical protein
MFYKRSLNPSFDQPLTGDRFKLFYLCRQPHTAEMLSQKTSLPLEVVKGHLSSLLEKRLLEPTDPPAASNLDTEVSQVAVVSAVQAADFREPRTAMPREIKAEASLEASPHIEVTQAAVVSASEAQMVELLRRHTAVTHITKEVKEDTPVKADEAAGVARLEAIQSALIGFLGSNLSKKVSAEVSQLAATKDLEALEQAARRLVPKLLVDRKAGEAFGKKVDELFRA